MSGMDTGSSEVTDWCREKGNVDTGSLIDSSAFVSATVLFFVSFWCGTMSSESDTSEISDSGISS